MSEIEETNQEKHLRLKKKLKIIGPIVLAVGLILTITGIIDFIVAMTDDEMGMPKLFFLCIFGMPIAVAGFIITMFGFRKEMSTYIKNEAVPVYNEMGQEITPAIKSMAQAAKEGINDEKIICECGTINDAGSKFCKKCGLPLEKTCKYCGQQVDPDSEFCNHCGKRL